MVYVLYIRMEHDFITNIYGMQVYINGIWLDLYTTLP